MNLDLNINTDDYCNLVIQDNTNYLDENNNSINPLQFKFKDTASIISVVHLDIREDELSYFKIYKHNNTNLFKVLIPFDGIFEVNYTVVPTREWYNRINKSISKETILNLFNNNLIILDKENLVHITNQGENYLSTDLFLLLKDINSDSISNESKELFSICKLRKCYVNLCYLIFENLAFSKCWNKNKVDSELVFKRDLVWMAINVILYLYKQGLLKEALRILSLINSCGGLCLSNTITKNNSNGDCGCANK